MKNSIKNKLNKLNELFGFKTPKQKRDIAINKSKESLSKAVKKMKAKKRKR